MLKAAALVRKLVLTRTGPEGGEGIDRVGAVSWPLILKGLLTFRDPKTCRFFTSTPNGRRATWDFRNRPKERKAGRDMACRIPGAEMVIYDNAGHGGIFQHQAAFVPKALAFLAA